MKSRQILISILALFSLGLANRAPAEVQIGVTADNGGIKEFYLAIGEQYRAPEKEIIVVRDRGIPDDDIPVVYFIARKANVVPQVIIDMRLGGMSWMDISLHYGLTAAIYYVDIKGQPGPPYGKAYGYYRNKPRKEWREIRLADSDIVNLVNLRFISDRYGYSPDEIIKMRSQGESFVKINGHVKQAKGKSQGPDKKKLAKVAHPKTAKKIK